MTIARLQVYAMRDPAAERDVEWVEVDGECFPILRMGVMGHWNPRTESRNLEGSYVRLLNDRRYEVEHLPMRREIV